MARVEGAPAAEEAARGEPGRAEGGGGDEARPGAAVAEEAEQGRRAVELPEPAAEAGARDERAPAPVDERGADEAGWVRRREPQEDLLHELLHQRARRRRICGHGGRRR